MHPGCGMFFSAGGNCVLSLLGLVRHSVLVRAMLGVGLWVFGSAIPVSAGGIGSLVVSNHNSNYDAIVQMSRNVSGTYPAVNLYTMTKVKDSRVYPIPAGQYRLYYRIKEQASETNIVDTYLSTDVTVTDGESVSVYVASTNSVTVHDSDSSYINTDLSQMFILFGKFLALGVTCGGLVFSSRFLWRFFQKLLGAPTWRE